MFYDICLLRDICKLKNNTENSFLNLPNNIIEYIDIFNGENLREYYILNYFKFFWSRYLTRILSEKSLQSIITFKINKCLCQYFINKNTKVYHYKAKYIQLFSIFPLNENTEETYLDELLIKFYYNKNNEYFYNIVLIINLKKFIINNEQQDLDKDLQKKIIDILKIKLNPEITISYKENNIYPLKMKFFISINSEKIAETDCIKYKILLSENNLDKMSLIKEFLKDKLYKHLNIE
jgi:hypothetical protein